MTKIRLRPTRGSILILVLAGSFFVASRTAGAGWLSVMVAFLVGLVLLSIADSVWSLLAIRIAAIAPTDATVGRRMTIAVDASAPRAGAHLDLVGRQSSERFWVQGDMAGDVAFVPVHRGVVDSLVVNVECSGSLGLVVASLMVGVPLPRPMDVAPAPITVALPHAATIGGQGETAVGGRHTDGETVRSVREYQQGDPLRMINWAATARRDELTVKELEAPQAPTLIISVDLRGDPEVAERHASLAAGYIQTGLRSGLPVVLNTHDKSGPHSGGVGSILEAGRRLARAVPGRPPPATSEGWSTVIHLGPRG